MLKKNKFVPKNVLKLHKDTILGLYSPGGPNGAMLYSCSKEGCVRILDLTEKKIFNTIILSKNGPSGEDQSMDLSAEVGEVQKVIIDNSQKDDTGEDLSAVFFTENTVYGGYIGGDVYGWNLKTGEIIYTMPGHTKSVKQIIQLNARIIASSGSDFMIRCWDTTTGLCESVIQLDGAINQMVKDDKYLYVLTGHNTINVINSNNYQLINSLSLDERIVVKILVKGNTFYLATTENKVEVFELKEDNVFEPKFELRGHKDWIHCMKILDNFLYTGSDDKTVRVWNLTEQAQVEEFSDHDDGVVCLEFCDGSIYSGSFDHTIRFWRIDEMVERIFNRRRMAREDLLSRKYEAYCKVMFKGKKKSKKKGAKSSPIKKKK